MAMYSGDVFPVVEHEVLQDVVLLLEVGENIEVISRDISSVGVLRGLFTHPVKQLLGESAAREMVVSGVGVDGFARRERGIYLCRGGRFLGDAAIRLLDVEARKFRLLAVCRIVICRDLVKFGLNGFVLMRVHSDEGGVLRHLAVGAVQHEEGVVGICLVRELDIIAQCIDGLAAVEEGGVVVVVA